MSPNPHACACGDHGIDHPIVFDLWPLILVLMDGNKLDPANQKTNTFGAVYVW